MNRVLLPLSLLVLAACGGSQQQSAASPAASAPASADAPLPQPVAVAMTRVRGMLAAVDDTKIKEAFSSDFLASVPLADLTQTFGEVRKSVGACSGQRPLEVNGITKARVRITCEHGDIDAKLVVQDQAPYRIDGLLLQPAQQ